jgi:hypothetical protein
VTSVMPRELRRCNSAMLQAYPDPLPRLSRAHIAQESPRWPIRMASGLLVPATGSTLRVTAAPSSGQRKVEKFFAFRFAFRNAMRTAAMRSRPFDHCEAVSFSASLEENPGY